MAVAVSFYFINYNLFFHMTTLYKLKWMAGRILVLAAMALCAAGCNSKMTSDEILDECGSGVVLIVNQYYYKATLPTGKEWFFTGFDQDGDMENWTLDASEIKKNQKLITGTGFFISKDGKILTNRHVAYPQLDMTDTKHSIRSMLNNIKALVRMEMNQMSQKFNEIEAAKAECSYIDEYGDYCTDDEKLQELNSQQEELRTAYDNDASIAQQIDDIDISEVKVELVSTVGVAYNNSFVTSLADIKPCVVTAVSDKNQVDLAMIQLKDKTTPSGKHVFDVDQQEEDGGLLSLFSGKKDKKLSTGQTLYMIGYNAGFNLASTSQGIKAQITSGTISQKSDEYKIMYTIPALPGSSGSPVIDEYGQLAAVNFAGIASTQSFNYGIQLKRVKQFVDNNE